MPRLPVQRRSDGTLRVRVVPLHATMGHQGMEASPVELLAVNVEAY